MYCFHCHDVQLRDNLRYHIIFTGAYPGFQRGGCLRSGPIRKVWGQFASGPIRKVGGGPIPLFGNFIVNYNKRLQF